MPDAQSSLVDISEFFFANWVSGGVNALLAVLGLAALVGVWAKCRRVRTEEIAIHVIQDRLAVRSEQDTLAEEEPSRDRLWVTVATESPDGYLRHRLALIKAIDAAGDRPIPDLLTAKVVAQLERELWLPKWVANSSVLLGLFGTLFGLSRAAAPLLSLVNDEENLKAALGGVFGGLTTAFSTTLAGILVAVPLGLALAYARNRQTAFVAALEDFSQQHVYPLYQTSPDASLERAARSLKRLETEQRKSFEAIDTRLSEMLAAIETLGTKLVRQLLESSGVLKQDLQASKSDITTAVASTGTEITGRVDRLLARQAELLGPEEVRLTSFAQITEELRAAALQVQALAQEIGRTVPSLEEAIKRQIERQTSDLRETMRTYTTRMTDGVSRHEHEVEAQLNRLAELLSELDRKLVGALATHEHALVERIAPAGDELRRAVSEAATVNQGVGRSGEVLAQLIDRVEFGLLRVQDVIVKPEPIDADRVVGAIEVLGARIAELKPLLTAAVVQAEVPRVSPQRADSDDAADWAAELLRRSES